MRVILSLIALALGIFAGKKASARLKNRAGFLSEILAMLNNFSSEIRLRAPTLEELLEREKCGFARSVAAYRDSSPDIKTAWESACAALPQKNEETALLLDFGKALINSGLDSAPEIIAVFEEKFARIERQAREESAQKSAAFQKIWTLCGIAAAVLVL